MMVHFGVQKLFYKYMKTDQEKIDELFFAFIKEAEELGNIAHSEQSHSSFESDKKESVFPYIKEYGDLLDSLNNKFSVFKSTSLKAFCNENI